MKHILLATFLIGISCNAFAGQCQVSSIFDMQAFGTEAVRAINLQAGGIVAGGSSIQMKKSKIDSKDCRELSSKALESFINLNDLKNELQDLSTELSRKKTSKNIKVIAYKENMTLSLKDDENVIVMKSIELEKIQRLEIRGDKKQKLIINVTGKEIVLNNLVVDISGDVSPTSITWNLIEAKKIEVKNTIDQALGISGKIVAPLASIKFENALVTGKVYAKIIDFNSTVLKEEK